MDVVEWSTAVDNVEQWMTRESASYIQIKIPIEQFKWVQEVVFLKICCNFISD